MFAKLIQTKGTAAKPVSTRSSLGKPRRTVKTVKAHLQRQNNPPRLSAFSHKSANIIG